MADDASAVRFIFEIFDEGKTGIISKTSLLALLTDVDPDWSEEHINLLLNGFSNQTGQNNDLISYSIFIDWLFLQEAKDEITNVEDIAITGKSKPHIPTVTITFVGSLLNPEHPSDSDHNVLLCDFACDGRRILSWNILCQYGYNEQYGFPFGGYCRKHEAQADYMARLRRTSEEVARLTQYHSVHAVLLQELVEPGEYGYGVMVARLTELLGPFGFSIFREGEFLTAVQDPTAVAVPLPVLERQTGKLQAVCCDQLRCTLLNVHLLWDERGSENSAATRRDLEKVIVHIHAHSPSWPIYLLGDTNRVPEQWHVRESETIEHLAAGLGKVGYPPGPTNVRWNDQEQKSEMTYADFAICIG